MSNMIDTLYQDVEREIEQAMESMFPYGAGQATHTRVQHHLEQVAHRAFKLGRTHALMGLMTAEDVAEHFQISTRRARALIRNRHERLGVGMKAGNQWLVHRDELDNLAPDEKYRTERRVEMQDKDRYFECRNCGQAVQGWHAAHEWFDCGCGNYQPVEIEGPSYDEPTAELVIDPVIEAEWFGEDDARA